MQALQHERPAFPRGTLAYQPLAYGWILREILQRITGETLEEFSAREYGSDLAWRYAGLAAHTSTIGVARL